MNGIEILTQARNRLSEAVIESRGKYPVEAPIEMSPWLAMSLLQKAIRRGHAGLALQAAATLLRDSPDRLWRRIIIIAFEDIGVADLETLSLATVAVSGKLFRARLGGEWAVASTIVSLMAKAPKCRAADDLVMAVERHPSMRSARLEMSELPFRDLIQKATGQGPLMERALAIWLAVGTDRCPSDHLPRLRGQPDAVWEAFCDAGFPDTVVEIAREGMRKSRQVLCPFVSLLATGAWQHAPVADDYSPPELSIRGVPTWAFDMFVREGRQALKAFLDRDCETARLIRERVPSSERINLLGHIVFAVEGGLLRSRLNWQTGSTLRRLAEHESQGRWCRDSTELIRALGTELPLLNEVRAYVA